MSTLVDSILAAEKLTHCLPEFRSNNVRRNRVASGQEIDLVPGGFVFGIRPHTGPDVTGPPIAILNRDGTLNLAEAMIHEGLDLVVLQDIEGLVLEEFIDAGRGHLEQRVGDMGLEALTR